MLDHRPRHLPLGFRTLLSCPPSSPADPSRQPQASIIVSPSPSLAFSFSNPSASFPGLELFMAASLPSFLSILLLTGPFDDNLDSGSLSSSSSARISLTARRQHLELRLSNSHGVPSSFLSVASEAVSSLAVIRIFLGSSRFFDRTASEIALITGFFKVFRSHGLRDSSHHWLLQGKEGVLVFFDRTVSEIALITGFFKVRITPDDERPWFPQLLVQ
ncbi:hypothetical protein CDD80_2515 [Ophiocordyceps camponoti-rufipedis]|uniref:Uncharacterized protein n=1 Tax=Ophiocordyceps camponoti-rufipedis TaxID=2004952 RepID=A0A2C5Z5E8_9HYPO|nr:hypothetical protein CDD80_2515 [Ophiocordyceps camponoti-rufipedis]